MNNNNGTSLIQSVSHYHTPSRELMAHTILMNKAHIVIHTHESSPGWLLKLTPS